MKKSTRVSLTVVAAVGLASCNRKPLDPCEPASFNQQACQGAIDGGGYYWRGSWHPMVYHQPYPHYYDSYRSFAASGGRMVTVPRGVYEKGFSTGSGGSSSRSTGVTRGGFGSTGSHGSSGS